MFCSFFPTPGFRDTLFVFFFSHYYCFSLIYTVVLLLYPGILRVDAFNANHPLSLPLSLSPYTIYLGVQASAPSSSSFEKLLFDRRIAGGGKPGTSQFGWIRLAVNSASASGTLK